MAFAVVAAKRATCDRKHVGAVIVDEYHDIVSTGYNGAPRGMPHCDDVGHELKEVDGRMSCVRTLHAESNALDKASWEKARDSTLYVTVTPCYPCAQRIVNAGIRRVVYGEWYESQNTALVADLLNQAGIDFMSPCKKCDNRGLLRGTQTEAVVCDCPNGDQVAVIAKRDGLKVVRRA
jgi:dCMP deaminase